MLHTIDEAFAQRQQRPFVNSENGCANGDTPARFETDIVVEDLNLERWSDVEWSHET
jgi:hypothetical protein